ncbi:MAG: hypothetical protein M3N19_06505, partial [Candidatus Eremiobacteraeota bacterium]|nr:hypothetical protein [Candidatus Eremiobacteraeota bacterium]
MKLLIPGALALMITGPLCASANITGQARVSSYTIVCNKDFAVVPTVTATVNASISEANAPPKRVRLKVTQKAPGLF